ncbi:MAG: cell division protein FtsW [Lachnospiraceae bacterium]|nr:cell division protein FtsW [Lachnospiraceae bacterium]
MADQRKDRKKKQSGVFDYTLLFIVLFLLCFGLVMLYSVSSYEANLKFGDSAYYLKKQLVSTIVGVVVLGITTMINYHLWEKIPVISYLVSLALILLVLTPLGYEANGARRWLNLGVSLQPAEVAKVGMIIFFASIVTKFGKHIQSLKSTVFTIALALPVAGTILFITENLSSSIIVLCIVVMMIFVATPNYKEYFLIGAVVIGIAAVLVLLVSKGILPEALSYRFGRINAWLNPENYASTTGFQTLQSLYAIGSGDIFGKGLGQSMQKLGFIPEAQNDMIFSIICEELGLFGAMAIILMFLIMIWRFLVIANNASDQYGTLLVVGVMAHISIQVILNIAVVTNAIPNTGITLPFISYGGSSIVFLLAEIGLVLSVSRGIQLEN